MKIQENYQNRGFALIATMAIMSLVVLIAVGSITLSKGVSKESNNMRYKHEAQSNARMALMIALGELQKELGPDQRISANMAVFAGNPETASFDAEASNDGYANPHYLGVWDSWKTWLSGDNSPSEIAGTYDRGRTSNFRKLLVSHPDSKNMSADQWRDFAEAGSGNLDTVALVSTGSLGSQGRDSDRVTAPLINTENGRYAWYVSGNNQKANVSLGKEERGDSLADSAASISNVTANGLSEKLDSSFSGFPTEKEALDKVISTQSAALLASNADQAQDYLNRNFHAFTAHSQSVLANVRKGGLKKDLNLFLELDDPVDEMPSGATLNSVNTRISSYNTTPHPVRELNGYLGGLDKQLLTMHLPSWEKIAKFYKEYELHSPTSSLNSNLDPYGTSPLGITRSPIMSDIRFRIGRVILADDRPENENTGDPNKDSNGDGLDDCWLTFTPIVSIWNPYNVAIEVPKMRIEIDFNGLEMRFLGPVTTAVPELAEWEPMFGTSNGSNEKNHKPAIWNAASREVVDSSGAVSSYPVGMNPKFPVDPFTLKPGESKIFSVSNGTATSTNGNTANAIYEPLEEGYDAPNPNFWTGFAVKIDPRVGSPTNSSRLRDVSLTGSMLEMRYGFGTDGTYQSGFTVTMRPYGSGEPYEDRLVPFSTVAVLDTRQLTFEDSGDIADPPSLTPGGIQIDTGGNIIEFRASLKGNVGSINTTQSNKSFVHSSPFNRFWHLASANDRLRRMGQYDLTLTAGSSASSPVLEDPSNANGAVIFAHTRNTSAPVAEVPTSPIYSLASLQSMRTDIGIDSGWNQSNSSGSGTGLSSNMPSPGLDAHTSMLSSSNSSYAISNSFASPHIPRNDIYQNMLEASHALEVAQASGIKYYFSGRRKFLNISKSLQYIYDYSFIQNDALFDDWFCSSITPQSSSPHFSNARSIKQVVNDFSSSTRLLPNQQLVYNDNLTEGTDMESELLSGSSPQKDAYLKAAQFMAVAGGFNVNSTSTEAWTTLFNSLRGSQLKIRQADNTINTVDVPNDQIVISRFSLPSSAEEGQDESDENSWHGVRYLTEVQIKKLANECVRQVKLRGPFLNMSDFINRRLGGDNEELSRVGALQAAIDWDEFNKNNPSASNNESINGRYKSDILDAGRTDSFPAVATNRDQYPEAHIGSEWTGIPGYVLQGDLLKRISNQIAVRDDTFTIRAYGESSDANGRVRSTAYCEAVVQRSISYVDADDEAYATTEELRSEDNKLYGRSMQIVSFRWLGNDEI